MNKIEIEKFINSFSRVTSKDYYIYPTIYKLNSSNKILIWYLERDNNTYRTTSGHVDGNLTTSSWTTCSGKNIGKKNATSPNDQAHKECVSKYENKLTKGSYVINKNLVFKPTYIKPMLAETYYSETADPETGVIKIKSNVPSIKEFQEGIIMQPKIDGVRACITKEGAFSRKGDIILGIPHVLKDLKFFFHENPNIILDGEIYNHNLEFNVINGTVRRNPKEDTSGEQLIRASLNYYVYDIINDLDYIERAELVTSYFEKYSFAYLKNLTKLNIRVNNQSQVNSTHELLIGQGFEGGMLRKLYSKYEQGKRSKNLLKVKQFTDAEYTVVDVIEGEGNNKGMAAKLKIVVNNVEIFPNMTGSWDFCKQVLQNKDQYIGGQVTVKYFGVTPDGSLRHPSVKYLYKSQRDL